MRSYTIHKFIMWIFISVRFEGKLTPDLRRESERWKRRPYKNNSNPSNINNVGPLACFIGFNYAYKQRVMLSWFEPLQWGEGELPGRTNPGSSNDNIALDLSIQRHSAWVPRERDCIYIASIHTSLEYTPWRCTSLPQGHTNRRLSLRVNDHLLQTVICNGT